ncbi:MAG: hypothetical protein QGG71_06075 [Pirellulaceae bacterium]|jgi:ribonuclease BN (tRNA processing enzyme)|nr:hypothetical protein [Planctomycetaceae bacterium]MDP6554212.1 hypothetical protein [Pirellulaceae bacterium]
MPFLLSGVTSALKIPYDYLDKVFIGHLHSDHFGDLGDLWIGGVIGNLPIRPRSSARQLPVPQPASRTVCSLKAIGVEAR